MKGKYQMDITISVTVTGPQDLAKLQSFVQSFDSSLATPQATKKKATTAVSKTIADDEDAEESFDLGADEETGTDTEEETETYTLKDVQTAMKEYAAENGMAKAGKILAKFKVKNVKELKPKQYADVIALATGA